MNIGNATFVKRTNHEARNVSSSTYVSNMGILLQTPPIVGSAACQIISNCLTEWTPPLNKDNVRVLLNFSRLSSGSPLYTIMLYKLFSIEPYERGAAFEQRDCCGLYKED
ncbi:hypothetical protein ACFE04_030316 [Oxalis oulophora]